MPIFVYEAIDKGGNKIKGELEAASSQEAGSQIRKEGYFPMKVQIKGTEDNAQNKSPGLLNKLSLSRLGSIGVSTKQLAQFTHQLSVLQGAGIPLLRSLQILHNQLKSCLLKDIIKDVSADIESGSSFSEALAKHPKVFDRLYTNMIKAGESGGFLDTILARLASFMEKTQALKRKVIGAMIYPAVVMTVAVIILAVVMTLVIPQFEKVFLELAGKQGLPPITEFVLGTARLVYKIWFLIPGIPLLAYFLIIFMRRSQKGRMFIDNLKLRFPIFGLIIRKAAIARFCRTLGTLLASGVTILESLIIIKNTSGNEVIADTIQKAHDSIREGENLAGPLSLNGVFDDMVVDMVEVGEETGDLDKMLMKIADAYEADVDVMINSLSSILEPVIIIFLGIVVGFIVLAIFMPLVSLMQNIGTM
jgi:type IV pilus assembly protein PilC